MLYPAIKVNYKYNKKKEKWLWDILKNIEDDVKWDPKREELENETKKDNLLLLKVNAFKLEHLLWEQASNGDMYPHLYSPLDISNVEEEFELPLNDDGNHILPEILKKYQFSRPR